MKKVFHGQLKLNQLKKSLGPRKILASAVAAICALGAHTPVFAQSSEPDSGILEEVIVTSQKRVQNIMDVPISVIALSGTKMEEMGIENLEDLTVFAPNVHFTETGISTQLRVRGIGSDNSQGFEQSVGMYVDGVYRSRAQLMRSPIYDIERVEVMRGPQNTLFGKNTISGAIDIITAKPESEFSGRVSTSYEAEFGTIETSGYVTGALNDKLNARLALRYYDDQGYMVNRSPSGQRDEPQTEELSGRVSFDWAFSDKTDVLLIAERGTFDTEGRAIETVYDQAAPAGPFAGANYSQVLGLLTGRSMDNQIDFQRQTDAPEFSDNTMDSLTIEVTHDIDGYELTSITGSLGYDYDESCDCDFTPANIFDLELYEQYDQVSQELRLASPGGETVDWIVGVFYQSYDQNFQDIFNVPNGSIVPGLVNAAAAARLMLDPNVVTVVPPFGGTGVGREFNQSSNSRAFFAEATYNVTDSFRATLGLRYTEEDKDASKVVNVVDIENNNAILNSPTLGSIYYQSFLVQTEQTPAALTPTSLTSGHNLRGSRDEYAFTPSLNLSFDLNDDIMVYAKYSEGFKAGGFDPRSNQVSFALPGTTTQTSAFEFEEETSQSAEVGAKMTLAEGKGELNLALYHTKYEDLQISQFDGFVGFNVGNAKETTVQGLEADGRWKLTDHITATYGFAYLDFEYNDFQNGNCYYGQPTVTGTDFCDYTGERGVYTPEYTLNLAFDYFRVLDNGLEFITLLDMQWVDEQQVHVNLDPAGLIDAYTMLSLRVAVEGERWGVALLGKNLLDEEVLSYSANLPASENFFGTNSHYGFLRRPRTAAIEATYKF